MEEKTWRPSLEMEGGDGWHLVCHQGWRWEEEGRSTWDTCHEERSCEGMHGLTYSTVLQSGIICLHARSQTNTFIIENPHQDGPAYFPVVAILSLGSPAVMDFTPHSKLTLSDTSKDPNQDCCSEASEMEACKWVDNHHPFSVLLMPHSLLIFKDEAYSDYLHGIKDSRVQQIQGAVNLHDLLERNELDHLLHSEKNLTETNTQDTTTICRSTTRISLTCRLVLKVHKNLFKF
ncbi:unnamed protein product [Rhodiola kirilowii]